MISVITAQPVDEHFNTSSAVLPGRLLWSNYANSFSMYALSGHPSGRTN